MSVQSNIANKKKKSKQERHFVRIGILFALPWLIGFLVFQLYPILSALYHSFTDYNIFQPANFIGIKNYLTLFKDPKFPIALKNTAFMVFISMPISQIVALLLALVLSKDLKGMAIFRTIYYLPTIVPVVASVMLFVWVLNPEYGILNNFLSIFGIRGPSWLSNPSYTKISLTIMDSWRCGGAMVIYLSALKAVPKTFYEAAELDGAGPIKRFFKITIPYIAPTIQFQIVMGIIYSSQYFTQAYVFNSVTAVDSGAFGGPSNSLLFYAIYLYRQGFYYLKMGYASTMAMVQFMIILIISFFAIHLMEKRINYDVE